MQQGCSVSIANEWHLSEFLVPGVGSKLNSKGRGKIIAEKRNIVSKRIIDKVLNIVYMKLYKPCDNE